MSPQSLADKDVKLDKGNMTETTKKKSGWCELIEDLGRHGHLPLFCVDEAHAIHQCGRSFRREFIEAMSKITAIRDRLPHPIPAILMSATLRYPDQKAHNDCLKITSPETITGSLARRNVMFQCEITGDEMATIKSSGADNLQQDEHTQILL